LLLLLLLLLYEDGLACDRVAICVLLAVSGSAGGGF
jgi:hypothetical protein